MASMTHGWVSVTPAEATTVASVASSQYSDTSSVSGSAQTGSPDAGLLSWAQGNVRTRSAATSIASSPVAAVRSYDDEIAKGAGKAARLGECPQEHEVRKDLAKLRLGDDNEPIMPFVRCSGCPHIEKWARFHNTWVDSEIEGVDGRYERACWMCVQKREHLPDESSARYWIIQAAPGYAKKQRVCAASVRAPRHPRSGSARRSSR